jgi:diguanylate cyclase (GGDEF)-like protein
VSTRRQRDPSPMILWLFVADIALVATFTLWWAASTYPLGAALVPLGWPGSPATGAIFGLAFWTSAALLGSLRVVDLRGRGVLTFHMPFIIAAMALGGPVAGGLVGLLGTFERREFRVAPGLGVLHNHTVLSLGGVLGGVALLEGEARLEAIPAVAGIPGLAFFLAVVAGTVVFAAVSVSLVAISVVIRQRLTMRETLYIHLQSYRETAAGEAVVGWLLALLYASVGWWAPIPCAILVLSLWRANAFADAARYDAMTGVASRALFDRQLERAVRRAAGGLGPFGLVYLDMNGLKALNDGHGHVYGDMLIRAVGEVLPETVRIYDLVARVGGDEFVILVRSVRDRAALLEVSRRIHEALRRPIPAMPWYDPSGSVGAIFVDAWIAERCEPEILVAAADRAMYVAKHGHPQGEPVGGSRPDAIGPSEPPHGPGVYLGGDAELVAAELARDEAERQRRRAEALARWRRASVASEGRRTT